MHGWRFWMIGAVICAIAGAIFYRPFSYPSTQALGDIAILMGGVFCAIALWRGINHAPIGIGGWQAIPISPTRHIRLLPLLIGAVLLGIVTDRNITWTRPFNMPAAWVNAITVDGQMLIFCLGVLAMMIGLLGLRLADVMGVRHMWQSHKTEIALLLLVTIGAFIIRAWDNFNSIRAFMDEGPFILAIRTMREEPHKVALLQPIHFINTFSYIYSYIQRIFSDVFGSNLGVFRLTSAMFGALTIPATYWLARELFDKRTAWLAALFLATFPPHVHFSRLGMNNIADPLFGVLAFASLIHAVKYPAQGNMTYRTAMPFYALSGAMLGMLPYFYEGGELLYPALAIIWLIYLQIFGGCKPSWRGILWLVIAYIAISFPQYVMTLGNGFPLFSRASANQLPEGFWESFLIAENGLSRLGGFFQQNVLPPLLHIFHAPDGSVFYGGETPLIVSAFVPLFLLGVYQAIVRPRLSGMLLLFWVMLTVLGNSLIAQNAWSARFVVVFPALTILMAVGLRYTLPMLPYPTSRMVKALGVGVMVCVVVLQGVYYFRHHLSVYQRQISGLLAQYDMMFMTLDLPPGGMNLVIDPDYLQYLYMKDYIAYVGADVRLDEWSLRQMEYRPFPRTRPYAGVFVKLWDAGMTEALWDVWELEGPYPSQYVYVSHFYDRYAYYHILGRR